MTTKHEKLIEGLAKVFNVDIDQIDFKKTIENTKWMCHNKAPSNWFFKIKSDILPLPPLADLPKLRLKCYCGTDYTINCLIKYIPTGQYAVIGDTCIKKCGAQSGRRCPQCHEVNKKRSLYCGNCRNKCNKCDKYHFDNSICQSNVKHINHITYSSTIESFNFIMSDSNEAQVISTTQNISPILRLKKHKGKTMDQVLDEDNWYIGYLLSDDAATYLSVEEKTYLKEHLSHKVKSVGKYSQLTWSEVKQTNPGMIKWFLLRNPSWTWLNDL